MQNTTSDRLLTESPNFGYVTNMTTEIPIFYSFRRCPYAMRARMTIYSSQVSCLLREVVLRDKPAEMLKASPKATVPVLLLPDNTVIDESLDIIYWALAQNDPLGWLAISPEQLKHEKSLIEENDDPFKHHLDRYKYGTRYENSDSTNHRDEGEKFLVKLDNLLAKNNCLSGAAPGLADIAIFPFIRQFANTDRQWFDASHLPNLQRWLGHHLTSQLFTTIMKKYPQWKTGDDDIMFVL